MKKSAEAAAKTSSRTIKTKDEIPLKREALSNTKKKNSSVVVEEELLIGQLDVNTEEVTVKDKWLKLYRDKYRAVDEARFRAIQVISTILSQ